jgi:lipooligosaccharide transport system permease protein
MRFPDALWGVRCVWLRYFAVFRKSLGYYLVTTFAEPVLFLLSFGLGVGGLVGRVHTQGVETSYRDFVFSGIIGQTILFQGFFEAAYGGFVRMYYQRIFQAMAQTPITLSEVLWGELLWDASKSCVAAEVVALIGVLCGSFPAACLLVLAPIAFLGALLFAGFGLAVAASSKNIEEINYPQYLVVFPMFLFCGVFFPLESLPRLLRYFAWVFPLTSINSLVRTVALGVPFQWPALPILAVWLVALVLGSRRLMTRRLVK